MVPQTLYEPNDPTYQAMRLLHTLRNQLTYWGASYIASRFRVPRDVVRWACRKYASRPALITEKGEWTFAQLHARSLRLAQVMRAAGLRSGRVVLYQVEDGNEQLEIRFAAYECGAITAFLPMFAPSAQVHELLDTIRPRLVITSPGSALALACAGRTEPEIPMILLGTQYEDCLRAQPERFVGVPIRTDSVSAIGATSGTTGTPKLMAQSQGAQAMSLRMLIRHIDLSSPVVSGGTCLSAVPLAGAGSGMVLPALISGTALVVPPSRDTATLVEYIERYQVARLFVTPSQLIDLLDLPSTELDRLRSVRQIIYGTESMPVPKLWEALKHFGPILQQGYGSAEMLPPVTMLSASDHRKALESNNPGLLRSSGKVARGVQVDIVNGLGTRLPAGEVGLIRVSSPTRFMGYWSPAGIHDPQEKQSLFMGDYGSLTADGYLYVLGRQADAVRMPGSGALVFPRNVEDVLHRHPAVKEAAVVALDAADAESPVRLYATVVLRRQYRHLLSESHAPWEQELLAFLRSRLEPHACPHGLAIMDQLPRSPLCKMVRLSVRDEWRRRLATPSAEQQ